MKRIISLLLSFLIIGTTAFAAPLYSEENEEILTKGVTLKTFRRFYGDYALGINVVTADLTNKDLGFELLKHGGGSDKTATVMDMVTAMAISHIPTAIKRKRLKPPRKNKNRTTNAITNCRQVCLSLVILTIIKSIASAVLFS